MGKKYIIELLDDCNSEFKGIMVFGLTQEKQIAVELIQEDSLTPYTEPDMEQVREDAFKNGYDAACKDIDIKSKTNAAYRKGLEDAWEAARKIGSNSMCSLEEMGFDFSQCAVDDYNPSWFVVKNYSASEAIEKIRQYEQEKEEQIQVGDEVTPRETEYDDMIVTRLWKDDYDSDCIDAIGFDGRICSFLVSRVSKTGKHYEIAEVLQKMKEA